MESWFFIAFAGYLFLAVESVISKILLTNKVKSWQLYSFYAGLLSLNGVFFAPFGLEWFGGWFFFESILTGLIFFLALVFLYKSLKKSSASRVFVLYGAITTLVSFFLSFALLGENFFSIDLLGIFLLIIGGFFISFKIYEKRLFSSYRSVIFSGFLMAVALIMMKDIFDRQNFITGYVFSRIGIFFSALSLLLFSDFRKAIQKSFSQKQKKDNQKNFGLVVVAKMISGLGTFLINFSLSLGSVALVSALVSVQYLLTFTLVTILALFSRKIVNEKMTWQNLSFKLIGVIFVVLGIFLVK